MPCPLACLQSKVNTADEISQLCNVSSTSRFHKNGTNENFISKKQIWSPHPLGDQVLEKILNYLLVKNKNNRPLPAMVNGLNGVACHLTPTLLLY